jgi:hypothetical protein
MNCPECFRYSENGYLCRRCIHEMMLEIKEDYELWLIQIEGIRYEESYYG